MDIVEIQFTKGECAAVAQLIEEYLFDYIRDGMPDNMEWLANMCSAWRALKAGANCGE